VCRKGTILRKLALGCLALPLLVGVGAQAATHSKANNVINLDQPGSWATGIVPTSADTAQWDLTVTSANATVLGSSMTWSNIQILNPGGPVTINADGNVLTLNSPLRGITMDGATVDFTVNCPITLGASQTNSVALGRTLTLNGVISGAFNLIKTNDGTMVLNGANTHTATIVGDSTLHCGVVSIGNNTALGTGATTMQGTGGAALWVSGGLAVGNNITVNGALGNGVTDYGNIRSLWGNNTLTGTLSGNASPRIGCDSGTLEFATGGLNLGTSSARTPNFIGAGNFVVSSVIANGGTGQGGIQHSLGTGVLRLSAVNTYRGPTDLRSGTTVLDYPATGSLNIIRDNAAALTLQGGALALNGGSVTELVSATSVANGGSPIRRLSGNSTLRLNAITRTAGATVDFGAAGLADTDTSTVNGILGGYATVAGADWATTNGLTLGDSSIIALASYETNLDPNLWTTPTTNVSLAGSTLFNVPPVAINSLRLTGASTVTIGAGATLTLSSGGLLVTAAAGATSIASGGPGATVIGGNSADLIVHQYNGSDLTIGAVIANNTALTRLAKSGPGRLILTGANTYSGNTYINAGTLSISANNNLGDTTIVPSLTTPSPAGQGCVQFNGGTLQVTATLTLTNTGPNPRLFNFNDITTSTIDVTGANVLTMTGTLNGRGWLTKIGTGTLVLAGPSTTYQGDVLINGGNVTAGIAEAPGVSGPFGNQATGAAVSGVSCFLHFGGGTLQYSPVNNFDYSYRFAPDPNQLYGVDVNGQTVMWASPLNSAGGSLTLQDSAPVPTSRLTLTAASTYNGPTTVTPGATLALGAGGSINNSSEIRLAAGATLDVLALAPPYNLSAGSALSASGTGIVPGVSAAAINGVGVVNLGMQPITLTYNGVAPALYLPNPASVLSVLGNAWTINGLPLAPGTPYAIAAQAGGPVVVAGVHTVYGPAIAGMTATIAGVGSTVVLTTSGPLPPTATTIIPAPLSVYGSPPPVTATVAGAAPIGTVLFLLDGVPQFPAVPLVAGAATLTPPSNLSAGNHIVVAQYSGDAFNGSSVSLPFGLTILPKPLTITGLVPGGSKVYDGTTQASLQGTPALLAPVAFGIGTPADGRPYAGDAVGILGLATGTYNSKDVLTATTVTFSGLSLNLAQAANYTITGTTPAAITPKALTVASPVVTTKAYDATTAATVTGTLQPPEPPGTGSVADGKPYVGDFVGLGLSAAFTNKNVGTNMTMNWSGSSLGGADVADYSLTLPTATGTIIPTNITVTAQTNTKLYDGNASAAAMPTVTLGSIQPGDAGNFTETYDTANVGTGKTLTPAGTVTDGNGGANYSITFVNDLTGVITAVSSSTALISSLNPSTNGNLVTFTATVSSGVGTPTGDVVFKANAVPFSTNALVSGSASASTAALPVGTNTVTAEYAAQANWLGSANNLDQVVKSSVTCSATNYILSIVDLGGGSYQLNFQGTAGAKYYVVTSSDVATAMSSWTPVVGSTNTAGTGGAWSATVSGAAPAYYRGVAETPCP
jgi:autotransporter-associated beta strand protein